MPPTSTPMATATNAALNRITCYLLVSGRAGELPVARSATVLAKTADVLRDCVLSRRGRGTRRAAQPGLAKADRKLRRGGRCGRGHRRESTAVGDTGLKVAELALQVRLKPAAVLALERPQVINPALKFLPLGDKRAHRLAVPLLSVPLQGLGASAGITSDLLRLAAGLGEHLVSLAACPPERLVRLAAGVGDRLVGGLLGQREHAGRRVHVVLRLIGPLLHHHGLGAPHRLLDRRLWHHRVRPRVRQRGAERHGWLPSAPQDLGQLGPGFFVLLDQPVKFSLNLVEEGVNLFLVVAGPEPGRTELLVPHIRGRQRHLVSSARLVVFLSTVFSEAPLFLSTVPDQHGTCFKVAAQPPEAKSVPR